MVFTVPKLKEFDSIRCDRCGDTRIKKVIYIKSNGELISIEAACGCIQEFIKNGKYTKIDKVNFSIPIQSEHER